MCYRANFLLLLLLFEVLGTGCNFDQLSNKRKTGNLSQPELERDIREFMKSERNIDITSFSLKNEADGSYSGTATARNGNFYDVIITPPGTTGWPATRKVHSMLR